MFEPPWRDSGPDNEQIAHWVYWLMGWSWSLAGLVLGALVAPSLAKFAGLWDTPYQDGLDIGVAVCAGFLVQLLGWGVLALGVAINNSKSWLGLVTLALDFVVPWWPIVGVGLGIYLYLTRVGVGRHSVTVAFVGGLLAKTLLIPLIKGIVTGALFRWVMRWLRGGKVKSA